MERWGGIARILLSVNKTELTCIIRLMRRVRVAGRLWIGATSVYAARRVVTRVLSHPIPRLDLCHPLSNLGPPKQPILRTLLRQNWMLVQFIRQPDPLLVVPTVRGKGDRHEERVVSREGCYEGCG